MGTTKHAKKRIKERCGIKKGSSDRLARLAKERGLERRDTKGSLRSWLDMKGSKSEAGMEFWIYGDKVFLFSRNDILITVLQIPRELQRKANTQRKAALVH